MHLVNVEIGSHDMGPMAAKNNGEKTSRTPRPRANPRTTRPDSRGTVEGGNPGPGNPPEFVELDGLGSSPRRAGGAEEPANGSPGTNDPIGAGNPAPDQPRPVEPVRPDWPASPPRKAGETCSALGAQQIGTLVTVAFASVAMVRGDHWLIRPDDAEICIGEPVAEWLSHQPRDFVRTAERYASGLSIGIGLATLAIPIIVAEVRLAAERKQHAQSRQAPSQRPQPIQQPSAPRIDDPQGSTDGRPSSRWRGIGSEGGDVWPSPDALENVTG